MNNQHENPNEKLAEAFDELFQTVVKALKIDKLVYWFADLLNRLSR